MMNLLAIAMLTLSTPSSLANSGHQIEPIAMRSVSTHAPHRLSLKEKAWFKRAIEDILQKRRTTFERGVAVSLPH